MKVYVIRHGQSEGNRLELHCGWSDTPLSALGHQQATRANRYLGDVSFDRIYCSDLPRAMQTAQDALPMCQPILSAKIREVGVGTLAGRPMKDCAAEYGELYERSVREQDFSAFGGETQAQMRSRVREFIQELEQLQGVDCVAVFGHEGTVHQMLSYALDYDVLLENVQVDNASASVFSYENGCWKLLKWNYTGQL